MLSASRTRPVSGALVSVPFTSRGTQYAVVLGYTPAGRMKVRAYSTAGRRWADTVRVLSPDAFPCIFPVSWAAAGLDRTTYEDAAAATRRPVRAA